MLSVTPEMSRPMSLAEIGGQARALHVKASPAECQALVQRFQLVRLDHLEADVQVQRTGAAILLQGQLQAQGAQACVVSGAPVPFDVRETIKLRFVAADAPQGEEIELESDALDELPIEGGRIDVGEAVAQSLSLALDPYPRADEEELAPVRRHLMSEEEAAAREAAEKAAANPFSKLQKPK